jgi:MFS family permease
MSNTIRNPWWVVVGSVLGLIVGNGPIMQFTFGVFVRPVGEELHADRGAMSAALMAGLLMTGLTTLLAGRLVDRFGARAVALPAITLFALGMMAIGLWADSTLSLCLLYGLTGIVAAGQTPLPYSKAIAANFDDKRGLALGIAMAGVGLGTALMPMLAQNLVSHLGWRSAYVGLGVITLLVALPSMAFLVTRPGEGGALATTNPSATSAAPGLSAAEALRDSAFWKLAVAFFLVAVAASGVIAHMVPLMVDRGVPAPKAAAVMGAAGLALIAGRLFAGWLLDRVHAPLVGIGFFVLPLCGIVLLAGTSDATLAVPAAVLVALGLGAEVDLIAYLLSRYLGLRAFGQIYGYLFAVFMGGSALGPFLMGNSFQALHSYQPALIGLGLGLVIACLLMLAMGAYRYGSAPNQRTAGSPHLGFQH